LNRINNTIERIMDMGRTFDEIDGWVRISAEAKRLGLNRVTIQRWANAGRIDAVKLGEKLWVIRKGAISAMLESMFREQAGTHKGDINEDFTAACSAYARLDIESRRLFLEMVGASGVVGSVVA
jgi:excisionase family DNA binding protein